MNASKETTTPKEVSYRMADNAEEYEIVRRNNFTMNIEHPSLTREETKWLNMACSEYLSDEKFLRIEFLSYPAIPSIIKKILKIKNLSVSVSFHNTELEQIETFKFKASPKSVQFLGDKDLDNGDGHQYFTVFFKTAWRG